MDELTGWMVRMDGSTGWIDRVEWMVRGGEVYLPETVVLKLNGGLGTSMGLDKAKSLLPVKGDDCFLDLTAKQVSPPAH